MILADKYQISHCKVDSCEVIFLKSLEGACGLK